MRPQCTLCGNYLLPCTVTANGIHPHVVDATTGKVVKTSAAEKHQLS